ncbi:thioredoxin family protein [Simplicispira suum]|jgi:thioredoxin 1|uniref:Thiol reductase thioredoxin n=1 Tax=Simplicispira suum TaxID=2109915 RepID=A0A2S0MW58_9BURK|nr:thioredoxin family protein [Simplicispira suum]AVO40037.1 thiol reductase thioredoxin [Simplicispira suum]MBW7833925.1 thioredoxin family protein [Simplicispira suum]MCB1979715.1 thioredoxin family protein [Burkholderiaceae bacterium]
MPFTAKHLATEPSRAEIDALADPTVLEFGTPWCSHCQAAQPLIEQALQDHPEIAHTKVEDGKGRPLGRSYGVKLWPTLVFLRGGNEVARLVRPQSVQAIEEALGALSR